jgi:hypothetical protein
VRHDRRDQRLLPHPWFCGFTHMTFVRGNGPRSAARRGIDWLSQRYAGGQQMRNSSVDPVPPNKQLERTVIRRRGRAACASFQFAHAARWICGQAAAQLRR